MNTTSLHIKIETSTKKQAQKTAEELGLSLSAVMKALLKQFIRTKQLSIGTEIPNDYLMRSLQLSDEEIRKGKVVSFTTGQDALEYLDHEIQHEKRRKPAS